ncbi:MAG TPA: helix-turn-helix domain-containing protein [Verrucomicrobiae bacterium]|nr:helix-turn-helix domain-containing protein [Verrucomicrobiae bacterium]
MPRTLKKPNPCAIHGLLELLARPWVMHILWTLSHAGPMRFGVLRRSIDGISSRVLTERLRVLEAQGLVFRNYETTIPPTVTYGITDRMKDMENVIRELDALGRKWQAQEAAETGPREMSASVSN